MILVSLATPTATSRMILRNRTAEAKTGTTKTSTTTTPVNEKEKKEKKNAQDTKVNQCGVKQCMCCNMMGNAETVFRSSVTGKKHEVLSENVMTCKSNNIIYLQTCKNCGMQHVGEMVQKLKDRMNGHRSDV